LKAISANAQTLILALLCAAIVAVPAVHVAVAAANGNGALEIRGLTWRTIAYYYHPGIYREIYNPWSNERLLEKAAQVGANWLHVRAFYDGTADGGLIGDDDEAQTALGGAIAAAHARGFKVFLTPYVDSHDYWVLKRWALDEQLWTQTVLKWAKFAQDYHVEMFSPGVEMSLIFDADTAGEWLKIILPRIRAAYEGQIVTAEHPYIGCWEVLDQHRAFEGYDGIGMTIFPWKRYADGTHDIRSFEDFVADVRERSWIINFLGDKYGIECRFVATLGMDFWQGAFPDSVTRAEGYARGLDVLAQAGLTGVFFHIWASEPDHLGDSTAVEEMLKSRWQANK
jgi:hypothetical protein